MAVLFDVNNSEHVFLYAHHSFGRLPYAVDTLISQPFISKHHGIIEWYEGHWHIRDLSSNGTWLNQVKLQKNQRYSLSLNDKIGFADPESVCYQVVNLDSPCDVLIPCHSSACISSDIISLDQYHLLPNSKHPEVAVFFDIKQQQWLIEKFNQSTRLNDDDFQANFEPLNEDDVIDFANGRWQLKLSHLGLETEQLHNQQHSIDELELLFELSPDEEVTKLLVNSNDEQLDFAIRSHHYLTLNLARYKVADAEKGLAENLQGWIHPEILATDLGLDISHLNIQIHRARKQFSDGLEQFADLDRLIERYAGKVRLGSNCFKIYKGQQLECQLPLEQ